MGMMLRRYHNRYKVTEEAPSVTPSYTEEADKTTVETVTDSGYTKTDINRMSKEELVTLAIAQRIENAEELSGTEIKKILIEKFGL